MGKIMKAIASPVKKIGRKVKAVKQRKNTIKELRYREAECKRNISNLNKLLTDYHILKAEIKGTAINNKIDPKFNKKLANLNAAEKRELDSLQKELSRLTEIQNNLKQFEKK